MLTVEQLETASFSLKFGHVAMMNDFEKDELGERHCCKQRWTYEFGDKNTPKLSPVLQAPYFPFEDAQQFCKAYITSLLEINRATRSVECLINPEATKAFTINYLANYPDSDLHSVTKAWWIFAMICMAKSFRGDISKERQLVLLGQAISIDYPPEGESLFDDPIYKKVVAMLQNNKQRGILMRYLGIREHEIHPWK